MHKYYLFIFTFIAAPLYAQSPPLFNQFTEFFEEKTGNTPLEDILSDKVPFKATGKRYRFGYRDSVIWFRFRTENIPDVKNPVLRIEYARLRYVTLYAPSSNGWIKTETGISSDPKTREIIHRFIVIPLKKENAPSDSYWYMRISTTGEMTVPVYISSYENFSESVASVEFYNGGFYGSILLLTFFNFFLYIFLKDKSYLYYILTLISVLVHLLTMDGYLYIWAGIGPQIWADSFSIVTVILTHVFILKFIDKFLMLSRQNRKFGKFIYFIITSDALALIAHILKPGGPTNFWIAFNFLLILIFTVAAAVQSMRQGFPPARFFLYAVILPVVFNAAEMLPIFGIDTQLAFQRYSLTKISTAALLTIFAIALADRIKMLRGELQELESEFRTARKIQDAIMPQTFRPIQPARNLTVYAACRSVRSVGGDFFQIETLNENTAGILIADVAGHGIPAAILASMVKSSFTLQKNFMYSPGKTLKGMNQYLCSHITNNFVTAQYLVISTDEMKASVAAGGHPCLYHLPSGTDDCISYKPKGLPLCIDENSDYSELSFSLKKGDRIFLFTDGVFETEDRSGNEYSMERLKRFLLQTRNCTPEEVSSRLLSELFRWGGSTGITDDVTYIIVDIL